MKPKPKFKKLPEMLIKALDKEEKQKINNYLIQKKCSTEK